MAIEGQRIGRYVLYDSIASGGMASVHFGRMFGQGGFARTVVIKRLHPHLVQDVEFVKMFMDEGRLAARIRHPNVVSTIDVASFDGELLLVMEYVRGESLSRLLATYRERNETIPVDMLSSIILGVLYGLEAAHEAKTEQGEPLGIVHRDVSPQNVMVGADGLARVADFGVAKAASRSHSTRDGKIKGKLAYMSPEQITRLPVDRRADIYAVGVMLWEALAGKKLFVSDDALGVMHAVLHERVPPLSEVAPKAPAGLEKILMKALTRDPNDRFSSALEMAEALENTAPPALQRKVGAWLVDTAHAALAQRDRTLEAIEAATPSDVDAAPSLPERIVQLTEQPTLTSPITVVDAPSMVTGLSVSGEIAPLRRSTSKRGVFAGAFGIVIVLATGFLFYRQSKNATPNVPDAPTTTASLAGAETSATSSAVLATPPATGSDPTLLVATPASASTAAKSHAHQKKKSANPACDPPTFVGPDHIEHFKPGCL